MFYNFFSVLVIYIFFFILILSAGKFANHYILRLRNLSLGEYGLVGFIFFYLLVLVLHFFTPINNLIIYIIYFFFTFFFIKNLKKIIEFKKINNKSLLLISSVFLLLSITNNHHDDLYIFQLPIINYMQNYKIVFGLINLNDFIGQGHSFYEIMALFKLPIYENRAYYLLPIIFLNFFVIFLFEILKNEKNHIIKYFVYFIIALLIIRFNRSKEYGTDLPILCLLFYIQINFFRFIQYKEIEYFLRSILASLFCVILKLYGIISIFYLFAFIPILGKDIFQIYKRKKYLYFLISLFLLTVVKNIIVSGCLIYPITQTCFDNENITWSIGKEAASKRNEFYNAQVKGWRAYTKNFNNGEFISAKDYIEIDRIERIKGLLSDKDLEKIITGFILILLFTLFITFSKNKVKTLKINKSTNLIIIVFLFLPFLIWLIKFPQSRYGYFSYISCLIYYLTSQYFNFGEINRKLVTSFFSVLLIFLLVKNISRINSELNNNFKNYKYYPIKEFRDEDYNSKIVNEVKFNIPTNSFMECGNIPMLCQASEEMIKSVKIYHGYYILENNPTEVIRHINSSAIYDMIETNK